MRLTRTGAPDRRFGRRGHVQLPTKQLFTSELAVDRRGRVVVAGEVGAGSPGEYGELRAAVLRLRADGRADRTFGRRGITVRHLGTVCGQEIEHSVIATLAIRPNGRIVVGGTIYDTNDEFRDEIGQPYLAVMQLRG